jgi:oligopeptide transport system substrate-binding protein
VRKAFTLATDRAAIVENVIGRGDRVASSFVPPGTAHGYTPPAGLAYSAEEARAALHQAGFASGEALGPVELLCTFNDERIAQALASMWNKTLGVEVLIRTQESKTFSHEKTKQQFAIARGNWYADYNDPTTFLDCLKSGNGNNDGGYSNARYDSLLRQAEQAVDETDRFEILRLAEEIVLREDCPILPVFHYTQMVAISPAVHGLHPNSRLWFPFRYAVVDR